jgi:tryptophanyl-tRNA synthetase
MAGKRVLTGIKTSGTPHLGNYVGAIRPAITSSKQADTLSFFFLADYHALNASFDPNQILQSTREIAATWLACGLDPDKVIFYRQSDIPEIPELCLLLNGLTAKGLMNRATAYKDAVQKNIDAGEDPDFGVNMGLYNYPILMAADILMFKADEVPVGRDQLQHLEMTRDIAARFNHHYGEHFVLPEAIIDANTAVLNGLDERKMSKSYNNTIPLFLEEKPLRKHINKIKTNLLEPGQTKDPATSTVFQIWQAFASPEQVQVMRGEFAKGIAWGEAKKQLSELINAQLAEPRERYKEYLSNPQQVEAVLRQGAEKARAHATPFLGELRHAVGLRPLTP